MDIILNTLTLLLLCTGVFQVRAQVGRLPNDDGNELRLPDDEVQALREIAMQVRKKDWNFGVDHVVKTQAGQDLDGMLPPSLVKLPSLKKIDLTRNYLSGTIPPEWASTKLEYLSVNVNNLSGPIPSYLGKISTLTYMNIENNLFSGNLPPQLGDLVNLENLILSANNLTGEIPVALTNLTKLRELFQFGQHAVGLTNPEMDIILNTLTLLLLCTGVFQVRAQVGRLPNDDDNELRLPDDEVQALREIAMQIGKKDWNFGVDPCSQDPSWLTPQSNLRPLYNNSLVCNCSDSLGQCHVIEMFLKGQDLDGMLPPSLVKLPSLKKIDLTRNYLSGTIPPEWASTKLEYLILSANNLTGEIPVALTNLTKLRELRINSNNFIGRIPDFFQSWKQLQELRISDLIGNGSEFPPLNNMTSMKRLFLTNNLLSGHIPNWIPSRDSGLQLTIELTSNIEHLLALQKQHSLYINCGGNATTIGKIEYEEDLDPAGAAKFVSVRDSWGFSSSGNFWDVNSTSNQYKATNVSILRMNNSELYMSARLSPLSLTYYARCLANRNYTVKLHFAEIVIRDNRSFYSLGRRIFDVYIQEQLVLKDFNIENVAQGVDKETVMEFKAVVRNKVLQIRFHWAGKGTTAAPLRGTYGPLISAISVESDFGPPKNGTMKILTGIVVVVLVHSLVKRLHGRQNVKGERFLKGQDLDGMLPPSLVKLPSLKKIDLTRNYLSGTIPPEWASTKLEYLSVNVNNLSGPIPSYLGNISTLTYMNIENNLFSGNLPPQLGDLVNLENLILSANNLTGEIPVALTNLTKLRELRINSNNFIGRIPDFFQSWKQLQELEIQASGLEGPIPSSISVLSNLTGLRISDLIGNGSEFPPLNNMTSMKRLFLTNNLLSGHIPNWIPSRDSGFQIDVSYNNFSEISMPPTCTGNHSHFFLLLHQLRLLAECMKNNPCLKEQHSLYINCGGNATTIGKIEYEEDLDPAGAAKFVSVRDSWGFSSSGNFWDVNSTSNQYKATNVSILRMNNSELYMSARLSPLSLTYYARCLANRNYTVKLHFAEIVIRDNRSFYSLGRRIFDVYIQEQLVLKDFNIENVAQGVDKETVMEFKAVVRNKVLQIRFHWAGKGTTAAPLRGTYGPLISAISVESDFGPPKNGTMKILTGIVVVVLVLFLFLMILGILWSKGYMGGKMSREKGYMAPEYVLWGYLTNKADVYSFGVVALEIVAGKSNMKFRPSEKYVCLLDWAHVLQQTGSLMELVDPKLGSEFNKEEAVRMIKVALLCTNPSPALRPNMSEVISMLNGETAVHELGMDRSLYGSDLKVKALTDQLLQQPESLNTSLNAKWVGSSITTNDLYSINKDSR
ncbi:putative leucine-rich repeat receptor-like serine/threonine-protein kinase [Quercus suber]|uniref:non-specific serine/threonine protein kinase n=1 Tax=Quercus suber TaxID=58331 RepID=A0AAW0M4I1_QUESU